MEDKLPVQGYVEVRDGRIVREGGGVANFGLELPSGFERWLNITHVMELTSLSESTVYRMIERDEFPAGYKIRGLRRRIWKESDVEAWRQAILISPDAAE